MTGQGGNTEAGLGVECDDKIIALNNSFLYKMKKNNNIFNKNKHQIFIGVIVLFGAVVLSVSTVLASPTRVSAQVALPCCLILPPPPPPIPPPILPIPLPPKSVVAPKPKPKPIPESVVSKKSKPTCTLSAVSTSIVSGGSATLSWNTTNAKSFSVDNGIVSASKIVNGTKNVSPLTTTTYTGTVIGVSGIATCSTKITVTPPPAAPKPTCTLTVLPTSIVSGGSATLSWGGGRISSVSINNSIGTVSANGSVSVSPSVGLHKYTGTFKANNNSVLSCSTTLVVTGGGGVGGCTANCGGGSVSKSPTITLTQLNKPSKQPLAFVYLSQIPYTGLDLGIFGTVVYWSVLIMVSFVSAYFVLFFGFPFMARKIRMVASGVEDVLNEKSKESVEENNVTVEEKNKEEDSVPYSESFRYSKYKGFKSFAQEETALTVGDIVKGLSRSVNFSVNDTQKYVQKNNDEKGIIQSQNMIKKINTEDKEDFLEDSEISKIPQDVKQLDTSLSVDTKSFLSALLNGDRTAVFSMVRQISLGGGSVENLISDVTCVLDDVYRSRTDGSVCDSDIVRLSAKYQTPVLEEMITALTTSIDSSYSSKTTAIKIALIRALSSIGA